jgi:hypothetical protein
VSVASTAPIVVMVAAIQAPIDVPTENACYVLQKSVRVKAYAVVGTALGADVLHTTTARAR